MCVYKSPTVLVILTSFQLYGDRSTFRQVIKKKAGEIVRLHYDFHPPEELEIECHNQEQLYEYISSAIIKIITKGEYLNGGKDEEVSRDNTV